MKRFVSMALLVAGLLSAGLSASAKGRKAEVVVLKRGDLSKEIQVKKCNCPRRMQVREFRYRDMRFERGRKTDFRFREFGPQRR